ncbi:hypothetical protein A9236_01980 [Polynucleobacter sp. QLW-P1DATA-2]|nr:MULTISPECIES: hypothetical protein [Polynucleobacter]OIN03685.1 hypothetical protein A9236_01980 [Polynucleobacter sp. QLW-P1DATA-2]
MNMQTDLLQQMERFPLRFCKPIYFGLTPGKDAGVSINNGTSTLLQYQNKFLALTCHHVFKHYRKRLREEREIFFSISNVHFDPEKQLIYEDEALDVVAFELTEEQASMVSEGSIGIGEAFFRIHDGDLAIVKNNDFVAYSGFPGDLRRLDSYAEINFGSYSSGACRVSDIYSDYICCEFEREHWISSSYELEPNCLGGISGGPAFLICRTPENIQYYKFAGVIYKMHESTESLYIRAATSFPFLKN